MKEFSFKLTQFLVGILAFVSPFVLIEKNIETSPLITMGLIVLGVISIHRGAEGMGEVVEKNLF